MAWLKRSTPNDLASSESVNNPLIVWNSCRKRISVTAVAHSLNRCFVSSTASKFLLLINLDMLEVFWFSFVNRLILSVLFGLGDNTTSRAFVLTRVGEISEDASEMKSM
jgi:hypothetical protein